MLSSQIIDNFHFLRPEWGLLLLLPLLALTMQWRQRSGGRAWDSIIAPHLLEALTLREEEPGARYRLPCCSWC